jgi:hypothetical protein
MFYDVFSTFIFLRLLLFIFVKWLTKNKKKVFEPFSQNLQRNSFFLKCLFRWVNPFEIWHDKKFLFCRKYPKYILNQRSARFHSINKVLIICTQKLCRFWMSLILFLFVPAIQPFNLFLFFLVHTQHETKTHLSIFLCRRKLSVYFGVVKLPTQRHCQIDKCKIMQSSYYNNYKIKSRLKIPKKKCNISFGLTLMLFHCFWWIIMFITIFLFFL